jgi:transforming growth factor-beta-induced protein
VRILKHHVVAGDVRSMQAVKLTEATTIAGTKLALAVKGKSLTVGGSTVTAADVVAGNGVIHVVDAVILPKD